MTMIKTGQSPITLINTFEVEPEHQLALIQVLEEATEQVMRHVPGFVSANIHRSLDGHRVVNYAQWESRAAFEAMPAFPGVKDHMEKAAKLCLRFRPELYEVAGVHDVPDVHELRNSSVH
jgi:quinol monooxygenase YgiN